MFNLILLFTSFTHAQYQYGAVNTMTQPYNLPYILTKDKTLCKNHGHEMRGELAMADSLVLQTPLAGGVLACAQSVMFHVQQSMCSDIFWASNNQCACLRPGVICKEERSESGFALYQLTRLGRKHDHHKKCDKLQSKTECDNAKVCEWTEEACAGKIILSKEHYTGAYPGAYPGAAGAYPPRTPGYPAATPGYPTAGYPVGAAPPMGMGMNPALGRNPAYGANGAQPLANLNTQLVPWRVDYDCDREIDEHTGLSNVVDLPPAVNANQCLQYVRQNPQCNQQQFVFQNRADHYPGGCACIRANLYCDEETNPGWMIFDFTRGPAAMGGVAPAGQFPQAHGMPPIAGMPATGAYPGARPGAYQAGYGAVPGAMPGAMGAAQAAYPPRAQAGALPQAGYPPRVQAGIPHHPGVPGAYPGAYPGAAGAYPPRTPGYPAPGYPAAGAYQAGMGYQSGIRLSKSHADRSMVGTDATHPDSSNKTLKLVFLYAVIPVACGLLLIAAVIGYKRYVNSKRTNFQQHILMEDNTPSV